MTIKMVIQRPGDTLVIPSRAPHTVLNLDWSIGVTENILTHEMLLGRLTQHMWSEVFQIIEFELHVLCVSWCRANLLKLEVLLTKCVTNYHPDTCDLCRSASQAAGGRGAAPRHRGLAGGEAGGEAVEMCHQEAGAAGHRGQVQAQGGHGAGMSCT